MRRLTIGFLFLWIGLPAGVWATEPLAIEAFINAPTATVWRIFTTAEGYKTTGVAQAEVDLRIGGEIRSHDDPAGRLGDAETMVNEILAYEPERMLALRVKHAPASLPNRAGAAGTWSVLYFNPAGENMTQVRVVGLGYSDSKASQALRESFAESARWTLDQIAKQYWPKCALCEKGGSE